VGVNAGDLIGLMGRVGIGFVNYPQAPTHVHIAIWRSVGTAMGFVEPRFSHPRYINGYFYGYKLTFDFF
jgi:hypothetical protein